jgi:hypothetical protein
LEPSCRVIATDESSLSRTEQPPPQPRRRYLIDVHGVHARARHFSRPSVLEHARDRPPYDRDTYDATAVGHGKRRDASARRLVVPVVLLDVGASFAKRDGHDGQRHSRALHVDDLDGQAYESPALPDGRTAPCVVAHRLLE